MSKAFSPISLHPSRGLPAFTAARAVPDRFAIDHGSEPLVCRALLRRTGFHFGEARSGTPAWRLDWTSVENEMVRALDAIRDCARIAWWDGSSIGLRLHGFLGLFDGPDGLDETGAARRGEFL